MNTQITWKNRPAMLKRGQRIIEANWRNRLDNDALDVWFSRNLTRYCAYSTGAGKPTDVSRIKAAFWRDVSKALNRKHSIY